MLVSILIPTLIERQEKYNILMNGLQKQIDENGLKDKIEIISICDNRTIPLSMKRNMLQKLSKGRYFTHLDDDDCFTDDYCKKIIDHIERLPVFQDDEPDIITYDQIAYVNDEIWRIKPSMECGFQLRPRGNNYDENMNKIQNTIPEFERHPWQFHLFHNRFKKVYRSDSDTNAREDVNWLQKIRLEYPKGMSYIKDWVGHEYHFEDPKLSTCQ